MQILVKNVLCEFCKILCKFENGNLHKPEKDRNFLWLKYYIYTTSYIEYIYLVKFAKTNSILNVLICDGKWIFVVLKDLYNIDF